VLVIEDNADIRESLGMLLTLWGYRVGYAESGPAGVERAAAMLPDVALVDYRPARTFGLRVAQRHPQGSARAGAHGEADCVDRLRARCDREEALAAGFDCHLVKPVDPAVLEEMLSA
jgi:CheY-like chemotaxis protein